MDKPAAAASTITLTFCDQGEALVDAVCTHTIGQLADDGFSVAELKTLYRSLPVEAEYIDLAAGNPVEHPEAGILIIRGGCDWLLGDGSTDALYTALVQLDWDKKMKSYGTVKNKNTRYNLCFSDFDQEPNYDIGYGRVIDFRHIPLLDQLRERLFELVGQKAWCLQCEGNYYHDVATCSIGLHGDGERRRVIGVRFGLGHGRGSMLSMVPGQ